MRSRIVSQVLHLVLKPLWDAAPAGEHLHVSDPAEDDLYEKCAGPERKYAKDHEARTDTQLCLWSVLLPWRNVSTSSTGAIEQSSCRAVAGHGSAEAPDTPACILAFSASTTCTMACCSSFCRLDVCFHLTWHHLSAAPSLPRTWQREPRASTG